SERPKRTFWDFSAWASISITQLSATTTSTWTTAASSRRSSPARNSLPENGFSGGLFSGYPPRYRAPRSSSRPAVNRHLRSNQRSPLPHRGKADVSRFFANLRRVESLTVVFHNHLKQLLPAF